MQMGHLDDHADGTPRVDLTRRAAIHRRAECMLDASTREAAAARSGLIDLHVAFVVDHADGTPRRAHVESCVEADLASLGWI